MDFIFFLLPVFIAMTISIFMTKDGEWVKKLIKELHFVTGNSVIEENLLEHYG